MRTHLFVAAGVALALAACGKPGNGDGKAEARAAPPPLPVQTVRVAQQKVPVSVEAVGQAEGSREVEIRARVSGILERRLYQEGAPVAAGQALFLIDPASYELAAQQARAALQQERVRRELAESDVKRLAPLAQEKAISQREADQASAAAKTAGAAIASAEAKLKEAELNLSYTRVTAPISGISGRAVRSEGSLVTANTDASLLTTLTQVDPIWVRFPLAEGDFERIRGSARNARVQLIAEDGKVVADNGRLNFTSTTVDAKTGAVQLRAEFPNRGAKWLPGQFAKIRLLAGEQLAMLVPQAAIVQTEQSRVVMTVGPENKVVPKPVQTASWIGSDAVVMSGLNEGDVVIVDNLIKVRPGATVQPQVPPKAAAR
jgi:membrane fusion protein (multidrug efflux system)